ncbi:MAG: hypothetical protein ACWGO1_11060 [Anaerolineales bacterium]
MATSRWRRCGRCSIPGPWRLLPEGADSLAAWQKACGYLGLLGAGFAERVDALDAYLDMIEEAMEDWAQASGV